MTVMGVSAACEGLHKHEDKAPKSDDDDENIVEDAERFMVIEDSAVEEEDTELDAASFGLAVLTTHLALVCDAPVNSRFTVSAKLSYDGRFSQKTRQSAQALRPLPARTRAEKFALTGDLGSSLREDQKARKSNQPIIDPHKAGLEAKAHEKSQAYRYQSK
ncbi:hypothetical protein HO133_008175 [Letharia lupina]|uniref:Uncharacterized protein n=1 Tax=Letharia lupina TaxID=560253 RepID=A0A8H6CRQ5_9LECA|nr:uncharacterized protein HO133_008175 [Letharia lupina]KAF6228445.1 hypothetical protein HO133_008175 [Letharia lupina]